jgi:trimeric autotransporter adhesin
LKSFRIAILFILSFALYSCGKSDGVAPSLESPDVPAPSSPSVPTALSISPAAVDTLVNLSQVFTATGGTSPYSYSLFSGSGAVLALTGNYTAAASAGSAVVRVTDSLGQFADAVVTIHNDLQISPLAPGLALGGTQSFTSSGGVPPVVFSIVSGLGSINSSSGFFTSAAAGLTTVRVTDSQGHTAETTLNVFSGLGISPTSATVSVGSTTVFSAAGGQSPYTYSVVSGGGSVVAATGAYTASASVGTAVIRATDALGSTVDANVSVINAAPVLSVLADQTTNEDSALPFGFNITDSDSLLNCTTSMTATSSNVSLLPVSGIVFSGTAPNCTATLTPAANQSGSSTVTLTVTDGVSSDVKTFNFTVNAVNDAPVISAIIAKVTNEDTPIVVNFTISDVDSTLNCSTSMTASTSNASLVAVSGIVFSGTAPNCAATITPVADQNGILNLTFRVSDTSLYADQTFSLTVNAINDAPVISAITAQNIKSDSSLVVNYTISDVDSTLNCNTSVTVSSGSPSVVPNSDIVKSGVAPNCVLTIAPSLNVAGTSALSVSVSDGSLSSVSNFNLTVINVVSVAVTPSSLNLAVAGVSQLLAQVTYSDSSSGFKTTSSGMLWSSATTSVATVDNSVNKGQVQGVLAGTSNVSATYKGVSSNNSAVAVTSINSVTVSTGAVTGGVGSQASISATAQNSTSSFDVTTSGVWTTSNAAVATVSNGVISYASAGTAVITVTYAGLSANVNVTVSGKSLVSLTIMGAASGVPVNGTKKLVATGTYSDASTEDLTNSAVWSSTNTAVASISNSIPNVGKVTGLAAGTSTVTANIGLVSANILLTVNSVTLSSIAISPYDALVTSSSTYSLKATATYSDASTADVTDLVTWSSSNTAAATISNTTGSKGVATTPSFVGYKSTTITATLASVTGTSPFGVNGATVNSILVTPTVTITPNQTYALKAYANLSDGGTLDLSDFVVWSSSSLSNVSVSNSAGSKGLVTGVANGTSTITALFNGVSGTRVVTVAASSSVTEVGTGLLGMYYNWTGSPPPAAPYVLANKKGERIDAQVNFAWGSGASPMGSSDQFAVRWTGFYKATSATNYFCTYSDDGMRVWINGVQVTNNWSEHGPTWDCSANQVLTVGTKYSVVIEFYENGGGAEAHLTRSSVSATDAQNLSRAILQSDLYPQ